MAYLNDEVLDGGLDYAVANGTKIDICNADPGSVYANVTTNTIGNKTGLTLTGPAAAAVDGRTATVPAITDGTVTANDDATHWALTDGTSIVVASGPLTNGPYTVATSSPFTLDAILLTIRDATAV